MNRPGDIIRKHCLPDDSIDDAVKIIMKSYDRNFTVEDAFDIIAGAAEEAAENPEDTKDLDLIGKVVLAVRRAYICGAGYATQTMFEMIQMGADAADREDLA